MKRIEPLILLLLLTAAAGLFLYTTPNGVGLTNDSAAYIGGARSIAKGLGYVRIGGDGLPRPITQFPPMTSVVIWIFAQLLRVDALEAARFVNLFCYLLNLSLIFILVRQMTKSRFLSIAAGVLFLCCGPVLQAHVYGLSEALFLVFMLAALNLLYLSVCKARRGLIWGMIGLLIGCCVLTRYAGLSVLAAALCFCLCSFPDWRLRFHAVLMILIGFFLPVVPWLIRNQSVQENAVNRSLSIHFPGMDKINEGVTTLAEFFLPEFGGFVEKFRLLWGILLGASILLLTAWCVFKVIRGLSRKSSSVSGALMISLQAVCYLCLLFLTAVFVDGSTIFDNRMLLPFFVLILILVCVWAGSLIRRGGFLKVAAMMGVILFALVLVEDESDLIRLYHSDGQGFAGNEWIDSETRMAALDLPANVHIFSNRQTFLGLMNDQPSFIIPPMVNAANDAERNTFEDERAWMRDEVLSGKAYVVIFNYQEMMEQAEDKNWLETVLDGIPVYGIYADGAIFGIDSD